MQTVLFKTVEPVELPVSKEVPGEAAKQIFAEAHAAFNFLKTYTLSQRIVEVNKVKHFILNHFEKIIDKIVEETGKARTDALVSEILGVLDHIEYLIQEAPSILAEQRIKTPLLLFGKKSYLSHEPLGVVLIVSPWNYPFYIGFTAIVSAFIAGNTVVYKPSEHTPLAWLFEEILSASPLMQSCVRVVYGSGVTGQRLVDCHPAKIFFTGSTKTGQRILEQAARFLIPVEVELGGKDAMIVFEDVDLNRTAAGALWGALTNCGQSCSSVERIYVQDAIYDAFIEKLKEKIQTMVLNSQDRGDADVGSMTTDLQVDIVMRQLNDAKVKGAKIVVGGECLNKETRFILPTLVTDLKEDMELMQDETFGPLLPVMRFHTEEEVVQEVNKSAYGLSASVWSSDIVRAKRIAKRLEVGAVSINNVMLTEGNPALPFGGVKKSGYGRTKGVEGLLKFTRSLSLLIDKQNSKIEANWFPYTRKKYALFAKLIKARFGSRFVWPLKTALAGSELEREAQKGRP